MAKSDQHMAPAMTELSESESRVKKNPVESAEGSRIRSLREVAGMSQGELASRVFVSRQTVINWEKGKTLPDIESVRLLSAAFGVTIDALLDERSEEYLRQTERDRRIILLSLAYGVVCLLTELAGAVALALSYQFLDRDTAHTISNVEMALSSCLGLLVVISAFRVNRVKSERGLTNTVEIMAFLEGYKPGSALPQTFLWRQLLPHWDAIWIAIWLVIIVLVFAPLFAMKMA